jgi:hypothetical protein
MRYLGLRERLALHEPLDLVVEAAMGAAHLLRRGACNPRSARAGGRARGEAEEEPRGGEEGGAVQKVWTVTRDGDCGVFLGCREERSGRASGVLAVLPNGGWASVTSDVPRPFVFESMPTLVAMMDAMLTRRF